MCGRDGGLHTFVDEGVADCFVADLSFLSFHFAAWATTVHMVGRDTVLLFISAILLFVFVIILIIPDCISG